MLPIKEPLTLPLKFRDVVDTAVAQVCVPRRRTLREKLLEDRNDT